ncbi:MAG TPA: ABC transporter permease [Sporichthyaceae bacterium]|nr:ABC transporter permease [Sporichthyaceae bacterium]
MTGPAAAASPPRRRRSVARATWRITWRDLQWRRRRFAFGVAGTALVFSVTLLLAGLSAALDGEADRAVQAVGADSWMVGQGAKGPFSSLSAMPDTTVARVAAAPGVRQADGLIVAFGTTGGAREVDVTIIGYRPGGLGPPVPTAGRQPTRPGEALVDRATGYRLGDSFTLSGRQFAVVGEVRHMTLRGGVGDVYLNLSDAQWVLFKGNRIVTTIVTKGRPTNPAALGLNAIDSRAARADLLRLFDKALKGIDVLRLLLWLVAIAVVGTTIYLSVLERIQDFAVLKAIGFASGSLMASLTMQAVVVSTAAAGAALGLAHLIAPLFPMPIYLAASTSVALVGISVAIGLGASVAGLRKAVGVDPAVAFGAGV